MENPVTEIQDVVRGLVCRPTLEQQEAVLRRYFAPDCTFHHFYIDVEQGGIDGLIAIYQLAETFFNYQDVRFNHVAYDAKQDLLAVRMVVTGKPWLKLGFPVELDLFVLLELEDFRAEDGRRLKRIKVQRDYFKRSPILLSIPVLGDIYDCDAWRAWLGNLEALLFRSFRSFLVNWIF